MELATRWWEDPLFLDMHETLLRKELNEGQLSITEYPLLYYRRTIVDWLAVICEHFNVCLTAKHLTIALYDLFIEHTDQNTQRVELLHLFGLGCFLIATKFEEQEINVPKLSKLISCVKIKIDKWCFENRVHTQAELIILRTVEWKVHIPTAAHFVEYFLTQALSGQSENFTNKIPADSPKDPMHYIRVYTNYFLELSLQEPFYRLHRPSLICSAAIACTRTVLQISPVWSNELAQITQYSHEQLELLMTKMLVSHEKDRTEQEKSAFSNRPQSSSHESSSEAGEMMSCSEGSSDNSPASTHSNADMWLSSS